MLCYNIITAKTLVHSRTAELDSSIYGICHQSFQYYFWQYFIRMAFYLAVENMEILQSLPVKSSYIITSKFMFMYLFKFFNRLDVYASGWIIWGLNGSLNLLQIILYFTSIIFAPLIPMCIAACMGLVIVVAHLFLKDKLQE